MIEGEYVKKYIQIDKKWEQNTDTTHLSWSPPLQANSHSASVGSLRLAQWQYACASAHDTCRTGWFILDTNTEIIFNMTSTHLYDLKTDKHIIGVYSIVAVVLQSFTACSCDIAYIYFLYLCSMVESGPSGCLQSAPFTGDHQGAAATYWP